VAACGHGSLWPHPVHCRARRGASTVGVTAPDTSTLEVPVNTQSKARPGRSRLARSTATVLAAAGLATVSLVATSGMAQGRRGGPVDDRGVGGGR
jgi:hypothetical protein